MRKVVAFIVGVPLMAWFLSQCRKPSGPMGRRVVAAMNVTHSALTDWGLSHLTVRPADAILDVGCGGGRTVQKLAALAPCGHVDGVDYSEASIDASRALNADTIGEGRVVIQPASVSALPFPDRTFDLVTAVETHYYWPDPPSDVHEILRVLKPGGRLALIAETFRGQRFGAAVGVAMRLLRARYLTVQQHRDLLAAAGFTDIVVDTDPARGWICALGRRPA